MLQETLCGEDVEMLEYVICLKILKGSWVVGDEFRDKLAVNSENYVDNNKDRITNKYTKGKLIIV